MIIITREYT